MTSNDYQRLAAEIKHWAQQLGFQRAGISDTDLTVAEVQLDRWLQQRYHGEMGFMAKHGSKRSRPDELLPGTLRVLSVRMDYLPPDDDPLSILVDGQRGYVARYALGRDYHKLMRNRLRRLAGMIESRVGPFVYRPFVDTAPVLEKPLAQKAGLGWSGKHTNLLSRSGGWFFLGELYLGLPLPIDVSEQDHCGRCQACIDICPTGAIVAPYQLDARRCISYLTIELEGSIPVALRPMLGNRIYGCDDCLLACPWNRFARPSSEPDYRPRHGLEAPLLVELFDWEEPRFLRTFEGSPIRRIGHQRWLRNIAVALGNAQTRPEIVAALDRRSRHASELVREHTFWALEQHTAHRFGL